MSHSSSSSTHTHTHTHTHIHTDTHIPVHILLIHSNTHNPKAQTHGGAAVSFMALVVSRRTWHAAQLNWLLPDSSSGLKWSASSCSIDIVVAPAGSSSTGGTLTLISVIGSGFRDVWPHARHFSSLVSSPPNTYAIWQQR